MNQERRSGGVWWASLAAIALVAAAARFLVWREIARAGAPEGEARTLEMLAWNVQGGIGFRDVVAYWPHDALVMPFFSLFLGGIYALTGESREAARVVLAASSVATCLAVAGIGRLAFGRRVVGIVAGFLAALYVPLAASGVALGKEPVLTLLLALGVYFLFRGVLERGRGLALASGIALGLAALTDRAALAALPAILAAAIAAASAAGKVRRLSGRILLPWLATILLVFSAWPVRNALVLGRFSSGDGARLREIWAATNPAFGGVTDAGRAWRDTLWRDPLASEAERNRRIEREAKDFLAADPAGAATSAGARALRHLAPSPLPISPGDAPPIAVASAVMVAIFSRVGTAGIVLALFRHFPAGLLLGGTFLSIAGWHALAGEDPRQRLPSEWLWILGVAYVLVSLARFHHEPLLALDARDPADPPQPDSTFGRHTLVAPLVGLLALPFLALAVVAAMPRPELPEVAEPAPAELAALVRQAGLEPRLRQQGGETHRVARYFAIARSQPAAKIRYPSDVVVWTGELSHFEARPDGSLATFSFRPGKWGRAVGDAHVPSLVAAGATIEIPSGRPRRAGIVAGVIAGTGSLGEPIVEVGAIRLLD